eukprot:CAMPEP_0170584590 /NCGR_PEP_ID=MMETSP0224-20130122/8765_1 /TAXON_ID=285029 /ORGANISM="Togula jolla, Strain CCCM 725" /LENGTH=82 /DNA_ID=CAMNT_0010908025 /DNA_START=296 /DNA_END=544 /DNA_ORIENTATION=-
MDTLDHYEATWEVQVEEDSPEDSGLSGDSHLIASKSTKTHVWQTLGSAHFDAEATRRVHSSKHFVNFPATVHLNDLVICTDG